MSSLVLYKSMTPEEMMAATGQGQVNKGPSIPRLKINRDSTDDSENNLPVGTFAVSQGDTTVFSKKAVLRPFINTYQYSLYDAREGKTVNRSIQFKSWGDEAVDEKGGVRCGKITGKAAALLSEQDKAKNAQIKCNRLVYGLVTMTDGVTQTGAKADDIVALPVRMKLSGSNFMPIGDAMNAVTALKRPMYQFNFNLSLTRQKNGATVYYLMGIDPDLKNILTMTDENFDTFQMFQEAIAKENTYIEEKYRQAIKEKAVPLDYDRGAAMAELSGDLNDKLPL